MHLGFSKNRKQHLLVFNLHCDAALFIYRDIISFRHLKADNVITLIPPLALTLSDSFLFTALARFLLCLFSCQQTTKVVSRLQRSLIFIIHGTQKYITGDQSHNQISTKYHFFYNLLKWSDIILLKPYKVSKVKFEKLSSQA